VRGEGFVDNVSVEHSSSGLSLQHGMWLTLHRKWKNHSGSLRNYETISYEWLLKGPFNGPKSLLHHKTERTSLGKATILTHFF
jgi:hypothetical protein